MRVTFRSNLKFAAAGLVAVLLCASIAPAARAQQPSASSTPSLAPQELSKSAHNPFADFIKVPIEPAVGFGIGPRHRAGVSVNVEPVVPVPLGSDWLLIARPSESVTYLPSPNARFGLQDLQTSFFVTPTWASEWLWGVGPIFQLPTATSRELGAGRWCAGPTAALIYSEGPWFDGILTYHLMSFGGDRDRGSVNQTYIEPMVSYNLESGWYGQVDPPMTYDWTADQSNAWTIPIGADIGKSFNLGAQALSLQVGSYDFVKHPDGAPQWMIRAQITFLFPTPK